MEQSAFQQFLASGAGGGSPTEGKPPQPMHVAGMGVAGGALSGIETMSGALNKFGPAALKDYSPVSLAAIGGSLNSGGGLKFGGAPGKVVGQPKPLQPANTTAFAMGAKVEPPGHEMDENMPAWYKGTGFNIFVTHSGDVNHGSLGDLSAPSVGYAEAAQHRLSLPSQ